MAAIQSVFNYKRGKKYETIYLSQIVKILHAKRSRKKVRMHFRIYVQDMEHLKVKKILQNFYLFTLKKINI